MLENTLVPIFRRRRTRHIRRSIRIGRFWSCSMRIAHLMLKQFAGVWRIRVEIPIDDVDKVMLEDNVELPGAP